MAEYIDKKQAIDRIASCYCMDCEHSNGILCRACGHQDDMDLIDDIPATDVQPIKDGRWIYKGTVNSWDEVVCSCCDTAFAAEDREQIFDWEFCPHCGAKMRNE